MSFIRKEDAAKAGKLIGAIVVVFGFAGWRVVSAMAPPKPQSPPPETVGGAAATSPTNGAPTSPTTSDPASAGDASKTDELIQPTRPTMGALIDPFRTIAPVVAPHPAASGRIAAAPMPQIGGPLPAATPLSPGAGTLPAPVAAVPAGAEMRVTGILAGANATAVVDSGKETYVVRVGSHLPDGTEVVSISATTVTLKSGGKSRVLDVGN